MSKKFREQVLIESGIVNDSGLTLNKLSAATPVDATGIGLAYNPVTKKVVRGDSGVVADKIYSFSPLSGVQSIPYAFFTNGPNSIGELSSTYITGLMSFNNIPAPTQVAPAGYKRVCDLNFRHTNFNSANKSITVTTNYFINGVPTQIGGETWVFDVPGHDKPKAFGACILGANINQAAITSVQMFQFYQIEQSLAPINMVNPDLRIDATYCIRLALI